MNATTVYRVIIAHEEPAGLDALEQVLTHHAGIRICAGVVSGRQLLQETAALQPDLVITGIKMPDIDGIEVTRRIKSSWPHIKVLALTPYSQEHLVAAMISAGVNGYLIKEAAQGTLAEAIATVMTGAGYFCKTTIPVLQELIRQGQLLRHGTLPPGFFTKRETDILNYMCQGLVSRQIAEKMGLSYNTVIKYRQNMYDKTGLNREIALVVYAVQHRVVIPDR